MLGASKLVTIHHWPSSRFILWLSEIRDSELVCVLPLICQWTVYFETADESQIDLSLLFYNMKGFSVSMIKCLCSPCSYAKCSTWDAFECEHIISDKIFWSLSLSLSLQESKTIIMEGETTTSKELSMVNDTWGVGHMLHIVRLLAKWIWSSEFHSCPVLGALEITGNRQKDNPQQDQYYFQFLGTNLSSLSSFPDLRNIEHAVDMQTA